MPMQVRTGRHPLAIFLLGACVVSGVAGLVDPARASGAVARLLPAWELAVWYGGLTVSSAIALVGVMLRKRTTSVVVERVGLATLGPLSLAYSIAVIAVAGIGVSLAAAVVTAFAAACIVRAVQITRDLNDLARRLHATPDPGGSP